MKLKSKFRQVHPVKFKNFYPNTLIDADFWNQDLNQVWFRWFRYHRNMGLFGVGLSGPLGQRHHLMSFSKVDLSRFWRGMSIDLVRRRGVGLGPPVWQASVLPFSHRCATLAEILIQTNLEETQVVTSNSNHFKPFYITASAEIKMK